jgi:4-amino-4-deoxy-L-arabinose transferase-like glycosyltransferase
MSILESSLASRTISAPRQRASPRWIVVAAVLAWAIIVVFLATYHLDSYPTTWFDEGSHLHVPKTLVEYGVYADISSEGFRYFGPTIGVGPMVMLPIALAFKLSGIGLLQARLVMALYLLAATGLFFAVTRHLYGVTVAFLASVLLITTPSLA